MKIAMTPRFFENGHDQLLAIERKYYPFLKNLIVELTLFLSGISMDQYLKEKPDAVAAGYDYTKGVSEFGKQFLQVLKIQFYICCGM